MVDHFFDEIPPYIEKVEKAEDKGFLATIKGKLDKREEVYKQPTHKMNQYLTLYDDGEGKREDSKLLAIWDHYFQLECVISLKKDSLKKEGGKEDAYVHKIIIIDHETISVRNIEDNYFAIY